MSILAVVALLLSGQMETEEQSFRHRMQTVDSLFQRIKDARSRQTVSDSAYRSMLEALREEEAGISEEAKACQFKDPAESNYWHRGRLKFPSPLQIELRLIEEGKDPAVKRE